jgi:hypothetical protein
MRPFYLRIYSIYNRFMTRKWCCSKTNAKYCNKQCVALLRKYLLERNFNWTSNFVLLYFVYGEMAFFVCELHHPYIIDCLDRYITIKVKHGIEFLMFGVFLFFFLCFVPKMIMEQHNTTFTWSFDMLISTKVLLVYIVLITFHVGILPFQK